MIDPDGLNVWFEDRLLGYIWRNSMGGIGFVYDMDWLSDSNFAISCSLKLTAEQYLPEDNTAHRFFANLLPEGAVRDRIVRDLKIPNTDFDLLRAIGGECAGAISILQVERIPAITPQYRELTKSGLKNLVLRRGWIDINVAGVTRPRLSLAGAQDKCPVLIKNDRYFLPEAESASSHILKFEVADYRNLPIYETFMTQLAKQIGLPVVDIELKVIEKYYFAQIKRYDRFWNDSGTIVRLHQEDFCQALGYGFEKKYQNFGGPSFSDCYRLLQDVSTEPIIDTQNLLRWHIFNVLAGNSDGHAKNISLLYFQDGAIRLAPFYDLICTRAIERIDYHLAFNVGGQYDPGHLNMAHWESLAIQCDVTTRYLNHEIRNLADSLTETLNDTIFAFEKNYGRHSSLQRIKRVVTQQCKRI